MNFRKPTIRSLLASQWLHDHLLKGAYSSPAMPIQTSYARASYASVVSFRIGHHTDGCSYVAMGKSQCKGDSPTHQHLAFVLHVRAAETLDDHRQDQWFPLKDGYPQPQQTHTFHPTLSFLNMHIRKWYLLVVHDKLLVDLCVDTCSGSMFTMLWMSWWNSCRFLST